MPSPNPPSGASAGRVRSGRYIYSVSYALAGLIFLVGLIGLWRKPVRIDDAAPARVEARPRIDERIDPNRAPWYDLAGLPGIGEIMAQRIVAYREAAAHDEHAPTTQPFRRAEDLQAVRGIGPRTVEKLRARLRFPRPAEEAADEVHRTTDR